MSTQIWFHSIAITIQMFPILNPQLAFYSGTKERYSQMHSEVTAKSVCVCRLVVLNTLLK